ncbi:MAG: DUF983 domain-containing protein [Sediminibacterium sp.]|nr:DUF983 domain-containing protein [Sediminibacterium sp.]
MNLLKTYPLSSFNNRCPRCREGKIFKQTSAYKFKGNLEMHESCPVCGQPTEIEVGFYYGTGYVSYAITVAISVATFVAWKVLIGLSFDIDDNRIFYWLGTNIVVLLVMQPLVMRLSRSLWLSWFVPYEPDYQNKPLKQPERINKEQAANW